ncbi:hypothetical protein UlMin_014936 [Ulmus minor]
MGEESKAFYVVRKGDMIGIFNTLTDCQPQPGSSVCDPPLSVYKGYDLPKEAEDYLVSHGLKNASYAVNINDMKTNLFGQLLACPYQQPASSGVKTVDKDFPPPKRSHQELSLGTAKIVGPSSSPTNPQSKHLKVDNSIWDTFSSHHPCLLCFYGVSSENHGRAGAGAVLRSIEMSRICNLREGVGIAIKIVAEYRAVILGLRHALKKGIEHILVQGDSKLVVMQMQGLWKPRNQNVADLCKVAKELMEKFISFQISHIIREHNFEAEAQAIKAINLMDGQVEEEDHVIGLYVM